MSFINRSFILSINIFLAFFCCGVYLLWGDTSFLIFYFILGGANFLILYKEKFNLKWIAFLIFSAGLFLLEFVLFSSYPKDNIYVLSFLYFFSALGFALNLRFNSNRIFVTKSLLFIYIVFLIFKFISVGVLSADGLNKVFFNSSRNIVGAVLIFLFMNYLICCYYEKIRVPFYLYLLVFIISILLYGRSGIVISFALMLYYLFFLNRNIFFLTLVFGLALYFFSNINLSFFGESTSFSQGLESARTDMRFEYFDNIFNNSNYLLFGRSYYECCYTIVSHDLNSHNSFISGHSKFGIIHTILVVFLTFIVICSKNLHIIFLFFLVLLRYFYDELGLFNLYDITLYLLVVICLIDKRDSKDFK